MLLEYNESLQLGRAISNWLGSKLELNIPIKVQYPGMLSLRLRNVLTIP